MADVPDKDETVTDDLRGDIARAFTEVTGDDAPPPRDAPDDGDADPPDDTGEREADAQRARDEAGRFAKEEKRRTLTLKDKAPVAAAPAAPDSQAKAATNPDGTPADPDAQAPGGPPARVPPPVNWKGAEKVRWEKLSPYLQSAIKADYERMERDGAVARPVMAALGESRELLEREGGGTIEGGVRKLLAISNWASQSPVEFVQTFIRQRGLNPAQIFGQGAVAPAYQNGDGQAYAPQPGPPPEIRALQSRLDSFETAQRQQKLSSALNTIDSFANDPAHPFFADVADDMEAFLKVDPSLGLKGAYERAVWANPATRAQLVAQQQAGGARDNKATVAAARNAKAANISGSPVPGAKSQPGDGKSDDLRAELERNYRAAMGGQRV